MIQEIIKKIKENDKIFVGPPKDISVLDKLSERMKKIGLPEITDELVEFYKEINGMLFNGIEIFSYSREPVIEPTSNFMLRNIYDYNRSISFGNWQYTHKFLFIGKSDEELYALNNVGCKFCIVAREDHAIYHMHSSLAELLYQVLTERGGIKRTSDKKKNIFFEGKLKEILLNEIINEINRVQQIPISIIDFELDDDLTGTLIGRETHHIIKTLLKVEVIDHIVLWSYNNSEPYKFSLKKYLSDEEINKLQKIKETNSEGLPHE